MTDKTSSQLTAEELQKILELSRLTLKQIDELLEKTNPCLHSQLDDCTDVACYVSEELAPEEGLSRYLLNSMRWHREDIQRTKEAAELITEYLEAEEEQKEELTGAWAISDSPLAKEFAHAIFTGSWQALLF